jgi:hypothetical protein
MNPDYRKEQTDPDGEHGHNERTHINHEIHRNLPPSKKFIMSERAFHKFIEPPRTSFEDLQSEFRMAQCKSKIAECNQRNCMTCPDYKL